MLNHRNSTKHKFRSSFRRLQTVTILFQIVLFDASTLTSVHIQATHRSGKFKRFAFDRIFDGRLEYAAAGRRFKNEHINIVRTVCRFIFGFPCIRYRLQFQFGTQSIRSVRIFVQFTVQQINDEFNAPLHDFVIFVVCFVG